MSAIVLQALDDFLLNYHVGQFLLVGFVFAMLASLPLKSVRVIAANLFGFGVLFTVIPLDLVPFHYRLFGLGLIVLSPVIYTAANN